MSLPLPGWRVYEVDGAGARTHVGDVDAVFYRTWRSKRGGVQSVKCTHTVRVPISRTEWWHTPVILHLRKGEWTNAFSRGTKYAVVEPPSLCR